MIHVEWNLGSQYFDQKLKISPYAEGDDAADEMHPAFLDADRIHATCFKWLAGGTTCLQLMRQVCNEAAQ